MSGMWNNDGNDHEYAIPVIEIDNYKPGEMANRVERVGVAKTSLGTFPMLGLGILAGIFIALGTQLFILVTHTATSNYGLNQLVGGVAFTLAMILIVITGAELFGGNCLVAMSFLSQKITSKAFARNLIVAFIGNFIGALTIVVWIYNSGQWTMSNHLLGARIILAANDKVNIPFSVAFVRGAMGNVLICLGVWLCYCGRSTIDRILALLWPISCLLACNFEHCVINMWLIPMGIILKNNREVLIAAEEIQGKSLDLSNLTFFKGFFIDNLCPVVLGNLLGGIVLVAGAYWLVYLHPSKMGKGKRENGKR